jgi:hypothetical protein
VIELKKLLHRLNEKSKRTAKWFFIETKFGIWLMNAMAMLNTVEGIIHLIVALIGLWGAFATGVFDFRLLLPIIENFILGAFSLLTGWALGIAHHHHHHPHDHEHKEEK